MAKASDSVPVLLSLLLPGLGQIYRGEKLRGAVVLSISLAILTAILWSSRGPEAFRSWLSTLFLELVYVVVWIPAVIDSHDPGRSGTRSFVLARPWYVVVMLITVGPLALPLLWHSSHFSRRHKLLWTAIVLLAVVGGLLFVTLLGPVLERSLEMGKFG